MKKHPVDDLFKRKLEGLERTPSENAWLKIQERQSARSRPVKGRSVVWGWYAAAGVAAAVMGGYLVWQNQQRVAPGVIHAHQTVATAKPARQDSLATPSANASAEQIAAVEKPAKVLNEIEPSESKLTAKATKAKKAGDMEPEAVQHTPVVAIAEKLSVPVNAIQPETLDIPVAQNIKTLPDEPAVSQVNKPEAEPTRMIVVTVDTGPSEVDDKPRGSRFSRVFRQLKNARAGEKVDWDEVGFNPKNLIARVDDRLRNKEDKNSEKDHPKDKTKL